MLKSTPRTSRIAAQMQRSLSTLLRRGVKDPRVGNVTVTAVDVANDLSYARIHVLPFAGELPAAQVLTGLRSASSYLRGELARELKLRHAPRLEFHLDTTIEGAQRLTQLIERAVQADRSRGAGQSGAQAEADADAEADGHRASDRAADENA
ncbi:MAG TPA: 30S ribosome-binding factor RbfA [Steroidobacteraceae bacterium]|nr:30S ribosome-binding factor RbfA [Steroidobacteraceae bacterium]